ncbi:MAG: hypothetical protein V3W19_08200 [Desulfatiglandales bacterium]
MTWYDDLSECDYFGRNSSAYLRAVGWLEHGKEYPTGKISKTVYDRLAELLKDPFQPLVAMGVYECDLCQFPEHTMGSANLFVPGNGLLYVCPELILHYINAHWYKPPKEFCDAVLSCPLTHSMEYKKSFLKNGGRSLMTMKS